VCCLKEESTEVEEQQMVEKWTDDVFFLEKNFCAFLYDSPASDLDCQI
jgi:hypothetical protein